MAIKIRKYQAEDLPEMLAIWNEVVDEGRAFPHKEALDMESASEFFAGQSHCGVAVDEASGKIHGLYILHPNNVGRCGHLSNASYAVSKNLRNRGIGRLLVEDSLEIAGELCFRIMQFNAVAKSNAAARALYEKLGFVPLGCVPGGFLRKDGVYEDICLYYHPVGEGRSKQE